MAKKIGPYEAKRAALQNAAQCLRNSDSEAIFDEEMFKRALETDSVEVLDWAREQAANRIESALIRTGQKK